MTTLATNRVPVYDQTDNPTHCCPRFNPEPWDGQDHLFAVSKPVPGVTMVTLSGRFLTRVFEGPFEHARHWCNDMKLYVEQRGRTLEAVYFFYTTCPRCAKRYGKNYVVALAKVL